VKQKDFISVALYIKSVTWLHMTNQRNELGAVVSARQTLALTTSNAKNRVTQICHTPMC